MKHDVCIVNTRYDVDRSITLIFFELLFDPDFRWNRLVNSTCSNVKKYPSLKILVTCLVKIKKKTQFLFYFIFIISLKIYNML